MNFDKVTTDHMDEEIIAHFVTTYGRTLVKAFLIGLMTIFAARMFNQPIGKSFIVTAMIVTLSMFQTWRRFLEPVILFVFLAAILQFCEPTLIPSVVARAAPSSF